MIDRYSYASKKSVLKRFLKTEKGISKEIRLFDMILKNYPDIGFWEQYDLGFQLNSILYFRRKDMQPELRRKYQEYQNRKNTKAEEIEYGEKITTGEYQKKKTLKNFLS